MAELNQAAFLPIFLSSMPSMNRTSVTNVGELTEAAQASPAFLGAHGELMHEAQGAFGAHTISGLHRAQSNGGEGGLDEIGSTEMLPVSGREVVEGKQHLTVPDQPIDRLGILCFVGGHEAIQRLYNNNNSQIMPAPSFAAFSIKKK